MKNYEFQLSDVRAAKKDGKRYAVVRAIANGTDTYNSVFTENARKSIITQILSNGVSSKFLHADTVWANIETYLDTRAAGADAKEKKVIDTLRGQLPMTRVPVGKAVDAKFVDDRTVEVTIEESMDLKDLGADEEKYINGVWNAVQNGVIQGVSVVFENVKSFVQSGKQMINDLTLIGLDFVDKAAHKDTRVLDVFVRAAAESPVEPEEKIEKGKNMAEEQPQDVDTIVEKAVKQKLDEARQQDVMAKQQEADASEKAQLAEEAKRLKEINQTLEQEKQALTAENEEALSIATEAVEKVKDLSQQVATKSNPHFEAAKKQQEGENDPFKEMSLKDVIRERAKHY